MRSNHAFCRHQIRIHFWWAKAHRRIYTADPTPRQIWDLRVVTLGCGNCYEDLSFLTWYMDKNQPLPPGKALDPYRERDFQRRKREKFPPPLYPANIPTPEATPAQQKEREKFWRG